MTKPIISIIMPIYKVERYMRQAIDSLINQTFKDLEIILVDDGSPDKCGEICDEYAQKDARVKVIHQENGGMGKAYNAGTNAATGTYIGYLESDDWAEPDMYEKLYQKITETGADVVKCNFWIYNSTKKADEQNVLNKQTEILEKAPQKPFKIEEYPQLALFHASHWAGLYKADFVKQIQWVETPSASYQDLPFSTEVLCRAQSIFIDPTPFIHYRNEGAEQGNSCNQLGERLLFYPKQLMFAKKKAQELGKYETIKFELEAHLNHWLGNTLHRIQFRYRYAFFKLFKEYLKDCDIEHNPYLEKKVVFDVKNKCFIRNIIKPVSFKDVRRFLFSIHLRKNQFFFQFLGIQISTSKKDREQHFALIKIALD